MSIQDFLEHMGKTLPNSEAFCASMQASAITSIRINPRKEAEFDFSLGQPVPWSKTGYYLSARPAFIADPLWHAGAYYVQEASSMFVTHVLQYLKSLQPMPAYRVLDFCAAPGGKTMSALDVFNGTDDLVWSNEWDKQRFLALQDNIYKWGSLQTVQSRMSSADFRAIQSCFDVVILDAPCSGSGMFRKEPMAIKQWNEGLVRQCSQLQQTILDDILPTLKPGGYLVYSTCSYSLLENEQNILKLLHTDAFELVDIPINKEWGITLGEALNGQQSIGYRFYPHLLEGEGFYCCVLRKKEGSQSPVVGKFSKQKVQKIKTNTSIDQIDNVAVIEHGGSYRVVPKQYLNDPFLWQNHTKWQIGIPLGEPMKKDWQWHHAISLIPGIRLVVEQIMDLDYNQSLDYLKGEVIPNSHDLKNGYVRITYKGQSIGFGKVVGQRINNLYPKALRIKTNIQSYKR